MTCYLMANNITWLHNFSENVEDIELLLHLILFIQNITPFLIG